MKFYIRTRRMWHRLFEVHSDISEAVPVTHNACSSCNKSACKSGGADRQAMSPGLLAAPYPLTTRRVLFW